MKLYIRTNYALETDIMKCILFWVCAAAFNDEIWGKIDP